MKKNELIKRLLKNFGLTLYKKHPLGLNPYEDIKYYFPDYNFKTFFDVGANVGQTVFEIRNYFNYAQVYSFEPFANTFKQLKENTVKHNIKAFQLAMGDKPEQKEIIINENAAISDMNSLINSNSKNNGFNNIIEKIEVTTIDFFCKEHGIKQIDYLNVDTEGYELNVLKGCQEMLSNQAISFIELEVGMHPDNHFHVPIENLKSFLENYGYRVFGISQQVFEWTTNQPLLQRANVLFISKGMVENYSRNNAGFFIKNK